MKVWEAPEQFHGERRTVVSVGNFDGVHRGHAMLIDEMVRQARREQLSSVVVTFEPHTRTAVAPSTPQPLLSSFEEKVTLLEKRGVDHVVRVAFDETFRRLSAARFVEMVLAGSLRAAVWVMGEGHRFGSDRMSDSRALREMLSTNDIKSISVELLTGTEGAVSSTAIRSAIGSGHIAQAVGMLGHPYLIAARRVRGRGLGSKLGYPTLNFGEPAAGKVLPPAGVYAAQLGAETGALYFGTCPTFRERERHLEMHLMSPPEEAPAEGEVGHLWLHRFIRGDRTFACSDELTAQITRDINDIDVFFSEEKLHAIDEGKDAGDY